LGRWSKKKVWESQTSLKVQFFVSSNVGAVNNLQFALWTFHAVGQTVPQRNRGVKKFRGGNHNVEEKEGVGKWRLDLDIAE